MVWRCAGLLVLALGLIMLVNGCSADKSSLELASAKALPASVGMTDSYLEISASLPCLAVRSLSGESSAGIELRCEAAVVNRRLVAGGGDAGSLVT